MGCRSRCPTHAAATLSEASRARTPSPSDQMMQRPWTRRASTTTTSAVLACAHVTPPMAHGRQQALARLTSPHTDHTAQRRHALRQSGWARAANRDRCRRKAPWHTGARRRKGAVAHRRRRVSKNWGRVLELQLGAFSSRRVKGENISRFKNFTTKENARTARAVVCETTSRHSQLLNHFYLVNSIN